jgi:hypothetical protein
LIGIGIEPPKGIDGYIMTAANKRLKQPTTLYLLKIKLELTNTSISLLTKKKSNQRLIPNHE